MGISRQSGESIKDYTIRLCRNREQYGLKWDDVAALINKETGDDYGESRYRKWFSAWSEGYEDGLRERLDGDPLIQEYEDKRIEMQKERVRLADQRRMYNQIIRQQARGEYLQELIHKALADIALRKPIQWMERKHTSSSHRESVLCLFDWHKGMFVDSHWNKFNDEEFYRRVDVLTSKSIEYNQAHGVDTVHVILGGDLIHGILRPTTRIQSTENVVEQTMHVAETLAEVLVRYANNFNTIKVYTILGNHARAMPSKEDAITGENYERLISWYLQARLQHVNNIEFMTNTYDVDIADAKVAGHLVYFCHGDKDKITNVVQNLTLMTGQKPSHVYMGHFHKYQRDEIHGVKVVICPSLCGTDSYAKDNRLTSDAAQLLTIFDETEGELCTYPIKVVV